MEDRTAADDLETLRTEGGRLRDVASVDLAVPVPTCPGWTQADLLRHVGRNYRWAARHVTELPEERVSVDVDPPGDEQVVDWFAGALDELVAALEDADDAAEVWTMGSDGTVRAWSRRMAHESLLHRWDAQRARGDAEGFEAALAVDGIDEFLDLRILTPGRLSEADSVLHVRAEDANADWSLDPEFDDELGRGFAEGDAHLAGPASDLLLTLWQRMDPDSVRWEGDRDAIRAWTDVLEQLEL